MSELDDFKEAHKVLVEATSTLVADADKALGELQQKVYKLQKWVYSTSSDSPPTSVIAETYTKPPSIFFSGYDGVWAHEVDHPQKADLIELLQTSRAGVDANGNVYDEVITKREAMTETMDTLVNFVETWFEVALKYTEQEVGSLGNTSAHDIAKDVGQRWESDGAYQDYINYVTKAQEASVKLGEVLYDFTEAINGTLLTLTTFIQNLNALADAITDQGLNALSGLVDLAASAFAKDPYGAVSAVLTTIIGFESEFDESAEALMGVAGSVSNSIIQIAAVESKITSLQEQGWPQPIGFEDATWPPKN